MADGKDYIKRELAGVFVCCKEVNVEISLLTVAKPRYFPLPSPLPLNLEWTCHSLSFES